MAVLSPVAKQQFFDSSGAIAAGYKLYTYATGTTTPETTYTNRAGSAANTNPVILDDRGECVLYLSANTVYDYVLKTTDDAVVWTREGIEAPPGPSDPLGSHEVQIIAHRGFASQAPENTLAAFSAAVRRGADGVECDVQVSSDGILYCFHDTTVDALTNGTGTFTQLSSTYIDTLDFDSTAGTFLADSRIARFADVLTLAAESGIEVHAEIKAYRTSADVSLFVDAIEDAGLQDQAWLHSQTISDLETVRGLNANIGVGAVGSSQVEASYQDAVDRMLAAGRGMLTWNYTALLDTPAIITYAKAQGVDVCAWTVNAPENVARLRRLGVRRIMTDISFEGA